MYRRRSKTALSRQKTGLAFLLIGIFFLATFSFLEIYQEMEKRAFSFAGMPDLEIKSEEDNYPEKILISSLEINLTVSPAKALDDKWEISETGASYLLGSGVPGEKGNVVIYGHNKKKLFGPISWLKKGAEIVLENRQDETFSYLVEETKIVKPDQIEVLLPTEDARLTLYTCFGLLDSKRLVVVAKLKPN